MSASRENDAGAPASAEEARTRVEARTGVEVEAVEARTCVEARAAEGGDGARAEEEGVCVRVQTAAGGPLASCVLRPNALQAATTQLCADVAAAVGCHVDLITFYHERDGHLHEDKDEDEDGAKDAACVPWDKTGIALWRFALTRALHTVVLTAVARHVYETRAATLDPWYAVQVPVNVNFRDGYKDWLVRVECTEPFELRICAMRTDLCGERRGAVYVLDAAVPIFTSLGEVVIDTARPAQQLAQQLARQLAQQRPLQPAVRPEVQPVVQPQVVTARIFLRPATHAELQRAGARQEWTILGREFQSRGGAFGSLYVPRDHSVYDRHDVVGMQPVLTRENFAQVLHDCCNFENAEPRHFHTAGIFLWLAWARRRPFQEEYSAGIKVWRLDPATRRLESTGRSPRTAFTRTLGNPNDPLPFTQCRLLGPCSHDALVHAQADSPFALSVWNPAPGNPAPGDVAHGYPAHGNSTRGYPAHGNPVRGKALLIPAEADWDEAGLPCYTLRGTFFVRTAIFGAVEFVGPAGLRIDVLVEDYDSEMRAVMTDIVQHGTHERGGFRVPLNRTHKFGAALQRFCEPQ
jgi:hypothetical protein